MADTPPAAPGAPARSGAREGDRPGFGVALLVVSMLSMTLLTGIVKDLSERVPLAEIMFYRFAFSLFPFAVLVARAGGLASLATRRPFDHAVRIVCGLVSLWLYFFAVGEIPLAEATTLASAAPIFVTMLSIPLLDERVGLRRWLAVAAGFGGVLLIVRPEGATVAPGALAAAASALLSALVAIWLRRLAATESAGTIGLLYNGAGTLVFLAVWLAGAPGATSATDIALMVVVGLLAGLQQVTLTESYRYAEASLLAPFTYGALVFSAAAGFAVWGEVPAPATFAGAGIIVASGLFILYRERRVRR